MCRMGKRKPEIDASITAQALAAGKSPRAAMLDGGYAESTASQGKRALSVDVLRELVQMGGKIATVGRELANADVEHYVRGKAYLSSLEDSDRGAAMLKLLGSDKRVSMFTPESQVGIIVVQPPPEWAGSIEERVKRMDATPVTLPPDTK